MNLATELEIKNARRNLDSQYTKGLPWHERFSLKVFRDTTLNVANIAIMRAYERNIINSVQMHEIAAILDNLLPKKGK